MPRRWLLAAYLGNLVGIVGGIVAAVVLALRPDAWPGPIALWVIGPLLVLQLCAPAVQWLTLRFHLTDSGMVLLEGLVERRERTVRWADVRAVDTAAPWAHRLLGLSRVTIAQGGGEAAQFSLPGVDQATRARVLELTRPHVARGEGDPVSAGADAVPTPRSPAAGATTAPHACTADASAAPVEPRRGDRVDDRTVLYRASSADLLVASLVLGQFAVVGGAAALALWELVDTIGLADAATRLADASPLLVGALAAVAIAVVGAATTMIRFAGFEVASSGTETVTIRFGAIEKLERVIDARGITGIALQRNVIELLLGRVRLALLTVDSSEQLGSNLLLPSLPAPVVDRVLHEMFGTDAPRAVLSGRWGALRSAVAWLVLLAPAGAAALFLMGLGANLWLVLAGVGVVLLVTLIIGRLVCSRLSFDPVRQEVALRTRFVTDSRRIVRASAVHLVATSSAFGRPWLAHARFYAGAPRRMNAAHFSPTEIASLATAIAIASQPELHRRLRRRRSTPPPPVGERAATWHPAG